MQQTMKLSIFLALFMLSASPLRADWIVERVSQPAFVAIGKRPWEELVSGEIVPAAAWIQTGRYGRVLLSSGGDYLQFKPNTVASVATWPEGSHEHTTIFQKFGELLLSVNPDAGGIVTVETPFLVTTVKGTVFSVRVNLDGGRVAVSRGRVSVIDLGRSEETEVGRGQAVTVRADGSSMARVKGPGPMAPVVKVAPRVPRVGQARPGASLRRGGAFDPAVRSGRGDNYLDLFTREDAEGEGIQAMIDARSEVPDEPPPPSPPAEPEEPAPTSPTVPDAPPETPSDVVDEPGDVPAPDPDYDVGIMTSSSDEGFARATFPGLVGTIPGGDGRPRGRPENSCTQAA